MTEPTDVKRFTGIAAQAECEYQFDKGNRDVRFVLDSDFEAIKRERDELQETFDLHWKADQIGIKAWQEKTGQTLTWPDKGSLVEWLLGERDKEHNEAIEKAAKYLDEQLYDQINLRGLGDEIRKLKREDVG